MAAIEPLTASAVLVATAATERLVMFTAAVVARHRVPAATWSSIWYLLSSFAVIRYTENWVYVAFAAAGSWLGAYASITYLHLPPRWPAGGGRAGISFCPSLRATGSRERAPDEGSREAIHSFFTRREMDCFRFARNDGGGKRYPKCGRGTRERGCPARRGLSVQ